MTVRLSPPPQRSHPLLVIRFVSFLREKQKRIQNSCDKIAKIQKSSCMSANSFTGQTLQLATVGGAVEVGLRFRLVVYVMWTRDPFLCLR
jgi:hypothetical protein